MGRHRSLSAAPEALAYTPSAISQQIATLEREVGVGLVERNARGAVLTDAGRALVRHADEILGRMAAAQEELQAMVGLESGRLRLGGFSTTGAVLVPRAVVAFRARHPGVETSLVELDPEEAVSELRAREIDLALVYEFPVVPGPALDGLDYVHLLDDRLNIALPAGHRLASRKRVRLADLADEPWVQGVYRGATVAVLPAACRGAGFEPKIVFRSDDHMAVQSFVAAGLGVAVVPQLTVPTARPDIVIRPLEVEGDLLTRRVGVAMPAGSWRPPAVSAMVAILDEVCTELRSDGRVRRSPNGAKPRRRRY
ncbi:MAG: LysR substrate-binding domain-containing protein [Gaiellaceae bacterium MAG52_C11]|nr:LysR substrate-binding domain-containing protein [Candidatus Gaiellasilicea maunaloa]